MMIFNHFSTATILNSGPLLNINKGVFFNVCICFLRKRSSTNKAFELIYLVQNNTRPRRSDDRGTFSCRSGELVSKASWRVIMNTQIKLFRDVVWRRDDSNHAGGGGLWVWMGSLAMLNFITDIPKRMWLKSKLALFT